jgi:hypothetical protein
MRSRWSWPAKRRGRRVVIRASACVASILMHPRARVGQSSAEQTESLRTATTWRHLMIRRPVRGGNDVQTAVRRRPSLRSPCDAVSFCVAARLHNLCALPRRDRRSCGGDGKVRVRSAPGVTQSARWSRDRSENPTTTSSSASSSLLAPSRPRSASWCARKTDKLGAIVEWPLPSCRRVSSGSRRVMHARPMTWLTGRR